MTVWKKLIIPFLLISLFLSCGQDNSKSQIYILHAGSLSVPFKQLADAFVKQYPEADIKLEAHGSRTCARHIAELGKLVDVFGSADSQVIRTLLIPEFADYCIDFANNEMVIMYTPQSKFAGEIDSQNWFKIFLREGVEFGHSDPNADPCGYRAVLTQKLAEKYYQVPGLYKQLKGRMKEKNIRPKEVDLIALLESGELDYIFIYKSVAQQHKMKYIRLPLEINLGDKDKEPDYATVSVKITGKKPGSWVVRKGAPMVYGITIPKNAPNPEWGIKFVSFLFSKQGRQIISRNGQGVIYPPTTGRPEKLPPALKSHF